MTIEIILNDFTRHWSAEYWTMMTRSTAIVVTQTFAPHVTCLWPYSYWTTRPVNNIENDYQQYKRCSDRPPFCIAIVGVAYPNVSIYRLPCPGTRVGHVIVIGWRVAVSETITMAAWSPPPLLHPHVVPPHLHAQPHYRTSAWTLVVTVELNNKSSLILSHPSSSFFLSF